MDVVGRMCLDCGWNGGGEVCRHRSIATLDADIIGSDVYDRYESQSIAEMCLVLHHHYHPL